MTIRHRMGPDRAAAGLGGSTRQNGRMALAPVLGLLGVLAIGSALASAGEPKAKPVYPNGGPPAAVRKPIQVLLVTGVDYPGHLWQETAPALAAQLRADPRIEVRVVDDPHFLDSAAIARYDVIGLHFMNWKEPGPGPAARENLKRAVEGGKGLFLVHFACGAWLDWPEFVQLAGRVWDPRLRGHDPRGAFRVEVAQPEHPIMRGMTAFDTEDELYTCLSGEAPIEILATARSKVDQRDYPIAFVLPCGKGRVFHCVLGHNAQAFQPPAVGELFRRGTAWAAGQPPVAEQAAP